jgi:hypothetical protein
MGMADQRGKKEGRKVQADRSFTLDSPEGKGWPEEDRRRVICGGGPQVPVGIRRQAAATPGAPARFLWPAGGGSHDGPVGLIVEVWGGTERRG